MRVAGLIPKVCVAVLTGCSGGFEHSALPPLDGFRTLLVGPRDGAPLWVVSLPQDGLRFDLPVETTEDVHGDMLLFTRPIEALDLEVVEGTVTLNPDPIGDPLPVPDRVLTLGEDRVWTVGDSGAWGRKRMKPRPCLKADHVTVDLGDHGAVNGTIPWSPTEVVLSTQIVASHELFIVSETESRRIPLPSIPADIDWRMAVDDLGHLWIVYGSPVNRTSSVAVWAEITYVELDRELRVVRQQTFDPRIRGEDGLLALGIAIGRNNGQRELFTLAVHADGIHPPHILRYREGESAVTRLAWPALDEPIAECPRVGVYRFHLEWRGPDRLSFIFRQNKLVHYDRGTFTDERISEVACGGILLDDRTEADLAIMAPEKSALSIEDRRRISQRGDSGWVSHDVGPNPLTGLDMTSWAGRIFASAELGSIVEVARGRGGVARLCPALQIESTGALPSGLTRIGDKLVVTGASDGTTRVHWLRERP